MPAATESRQHTRQLPISHGEASAGEACDASDGNEHGHPGGARAEPDDDALPLRICDARVQRPPLPLHSSPIVCPASHTQHLPVGTHTTGQERTSSFSIAFPGGAELAAAVAGGCAVGWQRSWRADDRMPLQQPPRAPAPAPEVCLTVTVASQGTRCYMHACEQRTLLGCKGMPSLMGCHCRGPTAQSARQRAGFVALRHVGWSECEWRGSASGPLGGFAAESSNGRGPRARVMATCLLVLCLAYYSSVHYFACGDACNCACIRC